MLRSSAAKIALIVLFALILGYYDLPNNYQSSPGTPALFKNAKVHLGLDLQGGSQLDYKIDLRKVPEKDRPAIVEGVRNVINRRVNSLGVSEPNIYTSSVGDEQHLIVELAGVKDLNEAKKVVGKTIQLEFKERREKEDPAHKANVKKTASGALQKILTNKELFELVGQEESQAAPDKVKFDEHDWEFANEISDKRVADSLAKAKIGTVITTLIEGNDGYTFQDQKLIPLEGFFILKLIDSRETSTLDPEEKSLEVSHILVAYKGAEKAAEGVLRTKEEAKVRAEEFFNRLKAGASFEKLAKESSDESAAKSTSGKLSAPVKVGSSYVEIFTNGALKLMKKGELSPLVETTFGFHIIRADNFTQIKYSQIFFSSMPNPWQETGLTGEHFEHADVTFDNFLRPTVAIKFNTEGAKLFEQITERNIGKPLAIFVGGNLISSPNVNTKIAGGDAVITGQFTVEEAQGLARDLNTGAIPAPVVLAGQYTIGATLGEQALKTSLRAGIIGLFVLTIFMILYYRLPGFIALIALGFYTVILLFLIKSELPLALSLAAAVVIFIGIVYTILKSKEGGWEKLITFILGCFVLFFVTFLLSNAVVLTLAGIAGVILSIGMAVDANILIFERTKEELRTGRPLSSAIDVGFDRAWSSIRDSNFSSLITCAILFYFGSSIIRGFAFNLAAGILISMFTAITITKTLLTAVIRLKLGERMWLWGVNTQATSSPRSHYRIIENTKLWFGISGTFIAMSLIALMVFGLKLGIDFNGGTLLDLSFEKSITSEELKSEFKNIQEVLNTETGEKNSGSQELALQSGKKPLDLEHSRIVPTGENQFIVNMEHIDNETHDILIERLQKKFGIITENRFTTIGPVVGETLKKRAVIAVMVAMAMIVLYIAFAFRKVPQRVSPWKFGLCAIVALMHDVLIPIGVFSIFRFEVDALFITAILTVLGFSVHDTIVVFDRIRENLKYQERDETFAKLANKSMTQTMARSINTSLTTLITLVALLLFGSASIFHFILVLVIGIIVGTYSSIFIASPLLVLWQKKTG